MTLLEQNVLLDIVDIEIPTEPVDARGRTLNIGDDVQLIDSHARGVGEPQRIIELTQHPQTKTWSAWIQDEDGERITVWTEKLSLSTI